MLPFCSMAAHSLRLPKSVFTAIASSLYSTRNASPFSLAPQLHFFLLLLLLHSPHTNQVLCSIIIIIIYVLIVKLCTLPQQTWHCQIGITEAAAAEAAGVVQLPVAVSPTGLTKRRNEPCSFGDIDPIERRTTLKCPARIYIRCYGWWTIGIVPIGCCRNLLAELLQDRYNVVSCRSIYFEFVCATYKMRISIGLRMLGVYIHRVALIL